MTHLRRHPLVSAGLAMGLVAAIVGAFAPSREIVEGPARFGFDITSIELPRGMLIAFLVFAAVLAAAMALPQLWFRLVGVTAIWGLAITCALMVLVARTNDRFMDEAELTILSGGWLLAAAFTLAVAGTVLTLVGFRRVADPPSVPVDEEGNALTGPTTSGHATAALVLGICSTLAPLLAAPAVAFGLLGTRQIDISNGHRTGRGLAVAGLVLGIVWMSIWGLLFTIGIFVATPTGE